MASLTGQQINATYEGLIKTTDNAAAGATPKVLTDGAGNALPMEIGTVSVLFPTGTVDFTGSTVLGLPSAAGLENGTGTDSLQSAASLTTNPADAANLNTVALGDNAAATTDGGICIGHDTRAYGNASSVAIGDDADGHNGGVGIGDGAQAYYGSVAIGKGASSTFTTFGNVHIGENAKNTTGGNGANVTIGVNAQQTSNAEYSAAIGYGSTVSANNAVALGANVTASTADTVSVKALETQTNSTPTAGGIIMSDAGGTDRRLNIDSSGNLQIDSTPVGGGAAGLESGTGTDSMQSSASLTAAAANAAGTRTIAIGSGATAVAASSDAVVIGSGAQVNSASFDGAIAIGKSSVANNNKAIVIGVNASSASAEGIAIGDNVDIASGADRVIAIGNAQNVTASTADDSIVIGTQTAVGANSAIAIGRDANVGNQYGVALGRLANVGANEAVAIGYNVTASYAQTVTMRNLQLLNYANLNYADDAAAAAGGIPLGGVYHTSGTLKIRLT